MSCTQPEQLACREGYDESIVEAAVPFQARFRVFDRFYRAHAASPPHCRFGDRAGQRFGWCAANARKNPLNQRLSVVRLDTAKGLAAIGQGAGRCRWAAEVSCLASS
jgi:hypothetical protein